MKNELPILILKTEKYVVNFYEEDLMKFSFAFLNDKFLEVSLSGETMDRMRPMLQDCYSQQSPDLDVTCPNFLEGERSGWIKHLDFSTDLEEDCKVKIILRELCN